MTTYTKAICPECKQEYWTYKGDPRKVCSSPCTYAMTSRKNREYQEKMLAAAQETPPLISG